MKLQCHSSEKGVISEPNTANGSCNAVFPKLRHIPSKNKSLVLVHADTHGEPDLPAPHGVCAAGDSPAPGFGKPNAYDWNFCWKVWDALRSCALSGADCRSALGKTPQHRSLGRWSDGVPVTPLKVQDSSPIRP